MSEFRGPPSVPPAAAYRLAPPALPVAVPPPLPRGSKRSFPEFLLLTQLFTGMVWSFPILADDQGGQSWLGIYLFFWTAPFFGLAGLLAMISFFRRPATRSWSLAAFLAPVLILPFPYLVVALFGAPVFAQGSSFNVALSLMLLVPIGTALALPRYFAGFIPSWLLRNGFLNVVILLLPLVLVALPIVLFALKWSEVSQGYDTTNDQAWFLWAGFGLAVYYALVVGVFSVLTAFYAYLCLFAGDRRRFLKMHALQMALAVLIVGGITLMMIPLLHIGWPI